MKITHTTVVWVTKARNIAESPIKHPTDIKRRSGFLYKSAHACKLHWFFVYFFFVCFFVCFVAFVCFSLFFHLGRVPHIMSPSLGELVLIMVKVLAMWQLRQKKNYVTCIRNHHAKMFITAYIIFNTLWLMSLSCLSLFAIPLTFEVWFWSIHTGFYNFAQWIKLALSVIWLGPRLKMISLLFGTLSLMIKFLALWFI